MANNPTEPPTDDFLQEILGMPNFASAEAGLVGADAGLAGTASVQAPMMLQLSSGDGSGHISALGGAPGGGGAGFHGFPLGLSLEQGKGGFLKPEEASGSGNPFRDDIVDGRVRNVSESYFFFCSISLVFFGAKLLFLKFFKKGK
jgi:hypothetical protein